MTQADKVRHLEAQIKNARNEVRDAKRREHELEVQLYQLLLQEGK